MIVAVTANAMTGRSSNLGGGMTQLVMPMLSAALLSLGVAQATGWRVSMFIAGNVLSLILGTRRFSFLIASRPAVCS